ncbi:MAG: Flavinator of succinate dehydrogenase-domain-containing protein [Monoraphidium minutum]|nr:MAG: Flavinator of succinate dehydrogenase-domain-containing protein [Monoraphidium minutum]
MALRQCVATALRAFGGGAAEQCGAALALAATRAAAPWRGAADAPAAAAAAPPACSCSYSTEAAPQDDPAERTALVNKLLYRSKQRGFLELDLLVGLWAEAALPAMSVPALKRFSEVLDEENPDLFKWLTGQLPSPDRLMANDQYRALKDHVASQLADNLHHAAATAAGRDWVRGWDDGNTSRAAAAGGQQAGAGGGGGK